MNIYLKDLVKGWLFDKQPCWWLSTNALPKNAPTPKKRELGSQKLKQLGQDNVKVPNL